MSEAKPRGRRSFRMSVRLLIAVVLLCGGIAPYINSIRVQKAAVRGIEESGGRVIYDWEWDPNPLGNGSNGRPLVGWRRRVAERLGTDAVASVLAVSLQEVREANNFKATEEHMRLIGRLATLRELRLGGVAVTEAGAEPIGRLTRLEKFTVYDGKGRSQLGAILARLGGLSGLREISITGSVVTDADLASLSRLSNLESLIIYPYGNTIGDAGLASLAGLTRLKRLITGNSQATSAGLDSLRAMTDLEHLSVSGPGIDDLSPLLQLPNLKVLSLGKCSIDDEDLAPLARLRGLTVVGLGSKRLTDAGLAHLLGLPNLEWITLRQTSVTDAGLRSLAGLKSLKDVVVTGSKVTPELD